MTVWGLESDFQEHLIGLLEQNRTDIEEEYVPFTFSQYRIDIRSIIDNVEEWRELKLLSYPTRGKIIQNLWTGVGKVIMMRRMQMKYEPEGTYYHFLSIPEYDFEEFDDTLKSTISDAVSLELVSDSSFITYKGE